MRVFHLALVGALGLGAGAFAQTPPGTPSGQAQPGGGTLTQPPSQPSPFNTSGQAQPGGGTALPAPPGSTTTTTPGETTKPPEAVNPRTVAPSGTGTATEPDQTERRRQQTRENVTPSGGEHETGGQGTMDTNQQRP